MQLKYVSQEVCNKSFEADVGSKSLPNGIKSSMLCAGIMEGGKDTCQVYWKWKKKLLLSIDKKRTF